MKELEDLLYRELSQRFKIFIKGVTRLFLKVHTYAYIYCIISIFLTFGLKFENNNRKFDDDLISLLIEGFVFNKF
jgi:hypothetical protein